MFALIFIHGVKLLHKHSFNLFSSTPVTIITDGSGAQHSSSFYFYSECDICNYQLTKNADHFIPGMAVAYTLPFTDHHPAPNLFIESSPVSFFENRGPPAFA